MLCTQMLAAAVCTCHNPLRRVPAYYAAVRASSFTAVYCFILTCFVLMSCVTVSAADPWLIFSRNALCNSNL